MDEYKFSNLSLADKADFVRKQGSFIEAQDFYSYHVLLYKLDQHDVELLYDFSNKIVSVEFIEKKPPGNFLANQLESYLDDTAPS
jgi:hypothetical protein